MAKIKLFEDFFNESENPLDDNKEENGETVIDVELSQDDLDSMADDDEEELDEKADPLLVTSKDIMRIKDIVTKANGSEAKARTLAETMCKLIKDSYKALRRARAAERENQHTLADIFFQRATELEALGA